MKILILLLTLFAFSAIADKPRLQLSEVYTSGLNIEEFWVSEKYDGVRGYWNGTQFFTRQGNVINTPDWFSSGLPDIPLDGELWIGRGKFDSVSGIVRRKTPIDDEWRKIKYLVFDLPDSDEIFDTRFKQLSKIIGDINQANVQLVQQFKVKDEKELMAMLDKIVQQGAEGLMLHRGSSFYKHKRTDDLLKLKKYQDTEAVVIEILPGKGKFNGMMGALLVELPNGTRFKIGTGFTNAERESPPKPGTIITFRYFGFTSKGKPRFASFLRIRNTY